MENKLLSFISIIKEIRKADIFRLIPNLSMEEFALLNMMQSLFTLTSDQPSMDHSEDLEISPEDTENCSESRQNQQENEEDVSKEAAEEKQCIKVSALVKELGAPPSVVSRTLRSLDKKGLITRTVDEHDRRNVLVWITEEGEKTINEANAIMEECLSRVFADVGEDNMRQLMSTIKKLQESLNREMD
ncbi:MAG: MarR family transcriptional regulator [Clostridiales bacterium]|nr:MarR family transcriptional regulator [Clostridiales bacterium]